MLIRYDSLSIILCTSYFILHCEDAQKRIEFSKRNSISGEGLSKASSEVHKTTNKQLHSEFFTFPCASELNLDALTWIENSFSRKCCDNLWSISTRNGNWMSDRRFFLFAHIITLFVEGVKWENDSDSYTDIPPKSKWKSAAVGTFLSVKKIVLRVASDFPSVSEG